MKKVLRRTIIGLLGAAVAITLLLLAAPWLLDALILPRLLARAGLPPDSVEVWRLTPFRLQGSVDLADDGGPLLSIPRLEIGYTPASLLQRRLSRLVLDHATLHLELRDGRPAPRASAESPAPPSTAEKLFFAPLMVDQTILRSCSIIFHEPGRPDLRIGLTAHSTQRFSEAGDAGYRLHSLQGTFSLTEGISASGNLTLSTGEDRHEAVLNLEDGQAPALGRLLPAGLDSSMLGRLALTGRFTLSAQTLELEHVQASGSLSRFHPAFAGFAGGGGGADETMEFGLSGPPEKLDYQLTGLRVSRPLDLTAELRGSVALAGDGAVRIEGTVDSVLGGFPDTKAGIAIPGTYQVISSAEEFEAELSVTGQPPSLGGPESPIVLSTVAAAVKLVRREDRISAHISGAVPELALPSQNLRLTEIALELPAEMTAGQVLPTKPGRLSIGAIRLNEAKLASVDGSITQEGETFRIDGSARALFDPALKAVFSGHAAPREGKAELTWSLPETGLSSSSLPPELGLPTALSFDTRLAADGTFGYGPEGLAGTTRAAVREGTLELPDQSLALQGLDCKVELPRLPEPASSPSQSCTVALIDVGKLHFTDAAATFRIEDAETLFIEQARTNWSQGTVELGGLRLSADKPEIDTTLYCSRINLAELLNQFGFEGTQGQGSLNGKLPIHLSPKGLRFDEGFLFSTPGTGGIVRFTDTDMLRQGMADVSEAGYLNYALRAMEDFAYDWTRLSFDTEGDNLLLSLNLEGKPRTPLPFGFKDGRIVETAKGELQYPIRLDVNFRLPLAELLQIGQDIKSLMENK